MSAATYLALADQVQSAIGDLPAGSRVPSEHALAAAHRVNRLTARAALQELERRYLVRRTRGAGTFVVERIPYRLAADAPPSFTETLRAAGVESRQEVIDVRTRSATAEQRAVLGLGRGERVTTLRRVGWVADEPVSYGASWLRAELVPGLGERIRSRGSLYAVLRDDYGLAPARLWTRAELDTAPADVAARLGQAGRPQVWWLESGNAARAGGPRLEVSRSWLRPDVFRLSFELGACGPGRE